jgi:hypothetical protein
MSADRGRNSSRGESARLSPEASLDIGASVAQHVRALIESAEHQAEKLRREAVDSTAHDREGVQRAAAVVRARLDLIEVQIARVLQGVRDELDALAEDVDGSWQSKQGARLRPGLDAGIRRNAEAEDENTRDRAGPVSADRGPSDRGAPGHDLDRLDPATAEPDSVAESSPGDVEGAVALGHAELADGFEGPSWLPTASGPASRQRRRGLFRRRARAAPAPPCAICGRRPASAEDLRGWQGEGASSVCERCHSEGWKLPAAGTLPYRRADQRSSD